MKTAIQLTRQPTPEGSGPLSLLTGSGCPVGYARVSTDEQLLDVQLTALKAADCINIYQEKVSGAGKKRPQLDLAIKDLQPGDTLVVWRLDRLARSMDEFYKRLSQIREAGATFRSLCENFDFNTAMGEFVLVILAAVAQLERQITVKRTEAGMEAARARGAQIGARVKFTPEKKEKAKKWLKTGVKTAIVAKRLQLSAGLISVFKREQRL